MRRQRLKLVLVIAALVAGSFLFMFQEKLVTYSNRLPQGHVISRPNSLTSAGEDLPPRKALVWVLTHPGAHSTKCKAIKETWGKRVDKLLFMSSTNDSEIPTIGLQVKEGLSHLTIKTFAAFEYIYANEFNNADWFVKADDDTYVIYENLRHFLSDKNPDEPMAYGLRMRRNDSGNVHDYLHGGSGYILSKEAVRRFGQSHHKECVHWDIATEDIMLMWCLRRLNVTLIDTVDEYGAETFMYATPIRHVMDKYLGTYKKYRFNSEKAPKEHGGISRFPITFHKISPEDMYEIDLFLYWIDTHVHS